MIVKKLRAVATALVLGTAAVTTAGVMSFSPAVAAVRPVVGKPLQEALQLAAQGNYKAAMAKVHQAEGASGLTADEKKTIDQTKQYIEVKSGGAAGVSTAAAAQAKFDADYRAGKFSDAISDEDMLRKYGALNASNMVIVAQAYYRMGNYKGCIRYATAHSSAGMEMLELQARCAFETGDDTAMRTATIALVAAAPTPDHWNQLLTLAERSKGLSDPQTLDIYRIKYLTGGMKKADDYFTLAQILLAQHLPSEAVSVIEKGVQQHVLVDQRSQRLLALAKQSQAGDLANLSKTAAAAEKAPTGDDLIRLGEDYCGMGKWKEAVAAITSGMKKDKLKDPEQGPIRLAQAYFGAGQKQAALSTLAKVKGSENSLLIAKLWELYIRSAH